MAEEKGGSKVVETVRVWKEHSERGQGLIEYSLVLSVVSIALLGALVVLGSQSNGMYTHIISAIGAVAAAL